MRNLVLYYRPTCPFCVKVLDFLEEAGIRIPLSDISSKPELRDELAKIGGKQQIPCLVIDHQAMYESDVIIDWLKTHCEELKKDGEHHD